jgi:hypothetical protein
MAIIFMSRESTLSSKQKNVNLVLGESFLIIIIVKNNIYDNPDQCDPFFNISKKLQSTNALKTQ